MSDAWVVYGHSAAEPRSLQAWAPAYTPAEQMTAEQGCYHGRKDSGTCSGSTDKAVIAAPYDNKTNVATLGQSPECRLQRGQRPGVSLGQTSHTVSGKKKRRCLLLGS